MVRRLWKFVRPLLVKFKRFVLFERPFGLGSLGAGSIVKWPRTLHGRARIRIGNNCLVLSNGYMLSVSKYAGQRHKPSIDIGDGVYIGRYVYLTAVQGITISDGCVLSEHVYITDLNHGFDPHGGPIMSQALESKGPVQIGPNCFLGYRVAVMPGVTLGEWCIVGANSVVTHSFPSYSIITGAPARLVKVYSHELKRWVKPTIIELNRSSS